MVYHVHKRILKLCICCLGIIASIFICSESKALEVVTTIKPIHSIASIVMGDTGSPILLIKDKESHNYSPNEEDKKILNSADIIFWIGPEIENYIANTIDELPENIERMELSKIDKLLLFDTRIMPGYSNSFHSYINPTPDQHIWLNIRNAELIAHKIEKVLSLRDAANAQKYHINTKYFLIKLSELDRKLRRELSGLKGATFIVTNDAYQYLEKNYYLHSAGIIEIGDDISQKAIERIRNQILREKTVHCIFTDPGENILPVSAIIKGTGLKHSIIDSEGINIAPGPDMYFQMMNELSKNINGCLRG